jgi:hypothetical protein
MKHCLVVVLLLVLSAPGFAQTAKAKKADGTECAALPCVVASVSLTNQTEPITPTTLFAPATSGLFHVTYYLESSHVNGSVWYISFKWTDDLKTRGTGSFGANPGGISGQSLSWNFRCVAGQPIQYSVTGQDNSGGQSFDLFVTVEQLQ